MENFAPWKFEESTLRLIIYKEEAGKGQKRYAVDLKECTTSANVLDWTMQVPKHNWATDKTIASLVRALQQYLDPQMNLCSGGIEKGPVNVKKLLRDSGVTKKPSSSKGL